MKNTYYIATTKWGAALYCKESGQLFLEDGGDGTSSECEDADTILAYAAQLFGKEFSDLDEIAEEIVKNGWLLEADDTYGNSAAAWIAANEE